MIHFLAKVFSEQDHADKFLRGELYTRRLSWFKKLEVMMEEGMNTRRLSCLSVIT